MERNDFENILKNKLADFTMTPPADGWKSLEASLLKTQRQKLLRRRIVSTVAAAAILLVAVLGSHFIFDQHKLTPVTPLAQVEKSVPTEVEIVKTTTPTHTQPPKVNSKTIARQTNKHIEDQPSVIENTDILVVDDMRDEKKSEKTQPKSVTESVAAKKSEPTQRTTYPPTRFEKKRKAANWSMGLYASNLPTSDRSSNASAGIARHVSNSSEFSSINAQSNNYLFLNGQKLNHKFPLSFGVGVRKNITDRIGVETGVVYTYLESSLDNTEFNTHYKQQLHYIGIPLSVTYTIGSAAGFEFYAMAGGMAEKCVSGKYENRVKTDILSEKREDRGEISAKSLQFSANVNAGVTYKLGRHVGLFLEPGLSYYFENDNQPTSYRTDNRLNFNAKMGLKTFF